MSKFEHVKLDSDVNVIGKSKLTFSFHRVVVQMLELKLTAFWHLGFDHR